MSVRDPPVTEAAVSPLVLKAQVPLVAEPVVPSLVSAPKPAAKVIPLPGTSCNLPALMNVGPVFVWLPENCVVPSPILVTEPLPLITPE